MATAPQWATAMALLLNNSVVSPKHSQVGGVLFYLPPTILHFALNVHSFSFVLSFLDVLRNSFRPLF